MFIMLGICLGCRPPFLDFIATANGKVGQRGTVMDLIHVTNCPLFPTMPEPHIAYFDDRQGLRQTYSMNREILRKQTVDF
jgi:hypothetical protein